MTYIGLRIFTKQRLQVFFHPIPSMADYQPRVSCFFRAVMHVGTSLLASRHEKNSPLEVLNQAGPFCNFNAFDDVALRSGVMKHHGRWGFELLEELGAKVGSQEKWRGGKASPF